MAQYLKGQSPATPILEDTGDLSLNAILEGKKKTICARMFYETLVSLHISVINCAYLGCKLVPNIGYLQIF